MLSAGRLGFQAISHTTPYTWLEVINMVYLKPIDRFGLEENGTSTLQLKGMSNKYNLVTERKKVAFISTHALDLIITSPET